ncbi:putative APO domain-containing protein [Helianthus annuus]|nr:putative APO domain-containing protein [Helianthus annuus]
MEHVLSLGGPSPTILGSFSTRWKQANDSISSLFFDRCHQGTQERHRPQASKFSIFACQTPAHNRRYSKKRFTHPQNTDLPPVLPKNKKKPYPIPLKQILQTSRADKKLAEMGIEKPLEPPKNGLLVPELIPVAYDVLDAWKILIKGLSQLLHVVPVHACRYCK